MRHKVEDYERWKPVFDEHAATQQHSGSTGRRLFRNADDPNELLILNEFDSLDNARTFGQSQDLKETMQRAGVADQPDVYYLDEIEEVRL